MKRLRLVILALALTVFLAGCGQTREVSCRNDYQGNPTCTETTTTSVQSWWNDLSSQVKLLLAGGLIFGLICVGAEVATWLDQQPDKSSTTPGKDRA